MSLLSAIGLEETPVAYSNLVAWYPFDSAEYGGNNTDDVTAKIGGSADSTAYDLSVSGTGVSYLSSGGVTDIKEGTNSGAYDFDGSGADGLVATGISGFGNDQPHTICFWVDFDNINGEPIFLGNDSDNQSSALDINSSSSWNWFFFGNDIKYDPSSEVSTGSYAHIALSYEGGGRSTSNETFYANGSSMPVANDGANGDNSQIPDPTQFSIGFDNPRTQSEIDGAIDDVRLYNKALSQTEVNSIVQNTQP